MLHPRLDPLRLRIVDLVRRGHERQLQVMGADRDVRSGLCLARGKQAEGEHDVQLQHTVVVQVPEVGLLAFDRKQARQVRAGQRRRHQLGERIVRLAERPDLAGAPRLAADPLLRIVAVLRVVDIGVPRAARSAAAAAIDKHRSIAVPGEELRLLCAGLVVTELHHGRELVRGRRPVDFTGQRHAVAHRDADVAFDRHLVPRFGRCPQRRPAAAQIDRSGDQVGRKLKSPLRADSLAKREPLRIDLGDRHERSRITGNDVHVQPRVALQPLGADQPFAAPHAPRRDQVSEPCQVGGADQEPAGGAAHRVAVDFVRRIDVLAIVREIRIEVRLIVNRLARAPLPALRRNAQAIEQPRLQHVLQIVVPGGRQRLAQPPVPAAAVIDPRAGFPVGVVVEQRIARPLHAVRNPGVKEGLVPPVPAAFQHESALVVQQLAPRQVAVEAGVQVLVRMGQLLAAGPRPGDRLVEFDLAGFDRQAEQHAGQAFAQRRRLEAVVGIAPGVDQVAAARQHGAPVAVGNLDPAPAPGTRKLARVVGHKQLLELLRIQPGLLGRDPRPLLFRVGHPGRQPRRRFRCRCDGADEKNQDGDKRSDWSGHRAVLLSPDGPRPYTKPKRDFRTAHRSLPRSGYTPQPRVSGGDAVPPWETIPENHLFAPQRGATTAVL